MRRLHLSLILIFVPSLLPALGQDVLHPIIGGFTVSCVDATRMPVYTRFVAGGSDAAKSTIDPMSGERLIIINYPLASHFPQLLQLFLYAHECGHHVSGDIVKGVYFREADPFLEQRADRIGIRLLRDELQITQLQADELGSVFFRNPAIPGYLPGPQRAKWISDCYKTNDDNCTVSHKNAKDDNSDSDDSDPYVVKPGSWDTH